ncbi:Small Multidrug Resistance (SMR) protein [Paraburkholderia sp. RAU2J]|uniref:ligand-binding protein SH3 n=1 Tax=Paraburkholderia sp. RAU2J TaxID=1938810 RepID=UPI000EB44F70|nr:ligand-binding protein SH3 [Paraburkholderia sp. RAU2J]RKT26198.1 Small Multidrug Resistance (SMR) protein [Paraburkholderia sp. RAU2J]
MAIFLLFAAGTLSAVASVLLRVAATMNIVQTSGGLLSLDTLTSGPMLMRAGAIGAYGAGFVLYALALRRVELSLAYPLMVGITIIELFGYGLFAGEAVTAKAAAGAALLAAGIYLIYA